MFLSKIWFFLIALAAAIAITVALVMPRPAQRAAVEDQHNRLAVACGVVNILLSDDARNRVDLASSFSRSPEIVSALESASNADKLDEARMKQVRDIGDKIMKGIEGRKPDFAMLIDRRGRVVARVRLDENDFGDYMAGRPLVDDALAGYLRDDIWAQNGTMYFVSAAPTIKRDPPVAYVGAVVLGHKVTNELAQKLVSGLNVDVSFYLGADAVAGSKTAALDQTKMQSSLATLKDVDIDKDCQSSHPIDLRASNEDYTALVARLPGEAQSRGAYYTIMMKKPAAIGFAGTLKVVRKSDLSFGSFPWILVGGAFLVALGIGIGLMFVEADRPLRKLAADAMRLAKSEKERLSEDEHGGKYGSIARSVNIHIDKLGREAKSARTNLDSLLGPAPEGGLGTIDLLAGALPSSRPGGPAPAAPSPPSDFRFSDPGKAIPTPPPMGASRSGPTSARPGTPPPMPPKTPARGAPMPPPLAPPPEPMQAPPKNAFGGLDDDILGKGDGEPTSLVDPYFKTVYDQFVAVKQSCNEPTAGLTYQKFSEKLVKNRDDLIAKTGCKEVRFTVYVKDGKAALKATPVKEE
ncbi:MAG TPA: MXAN_5187 family protein [Kofleriaceae bacterium]